MTDDNHRPGFIMDKKMSRRRFLEIGFVTAASCLLPSKLIAALKEPVPSERSLSFYNPYTKEKLNAVYWKNGKYIKDELAEINHVFRDLRTGRVKNIDKNLLNLLYNIQQKLDFSESFHIVSGYRTPKSNAILMQKRKVVSKRSFHIYGKAVDIRVPGLKTRNIRRAAMELKKGGVGYYPRTGTLHLDVGNVRYWRG